MSVRDSIERLAADLESRRLREQAEALKDKAIRRALTGDETVREIAKRLGVTVTRVHDVKAGRR